MNCVIGQKLLCYERWWISIPWIWRSENRTTHGLFPDDHRILESIIRDNAQSQCNKMSIMRIAYDLISVQGLKAYARKKRSMQDVGRSNLQYSHNIRRKNRYIYISNFKVNINIIYIYIICISFIRLNRKKILSRKHFFLHNVLSHGDCASRNRIFMNLTITIRFCNKMWMYESIYPLKHYNS